MPLNKEIIESKKVRRKLAEVAVDAIQEELALQKRVAALEARIARLAAALEKVIINRMDDGGSCEYYGTDAGCACSECVARAALTADDRKAGARLRALEAVAKAAERWFALTVKANRDGLGEDLEQRDWAMEKTAAALDALVRAVAAGKEE